MAYFRAYFAIALPLLAGCAVGGADSELTHGAGEPNGAPSTYEPRFDASPSEGSVDDPPDLRDGGASPDVADDASQGAPDVPLEDAGGEDTRVGKIDTGAADVVDEPPCTPDSCGNPVYHACCPSTGACYVKSCGTACCPP